MAGETLYFVRSGAANALNGIYSYNPGNATVKQLEASSVAIANSVYGGEFTGQDNTFIYQVYPWGSSGPAQAIIK